MVVPGLPAVRVRGWSAWAPGLSAREDWLAFLRAPHALGSAGMPEVKFIAPMQARRMSRLNRMALCAGHACCADAGVPEDSVRLVMASRHGDLSVMVRLLKALAEKETVLPADFTNSVHHTAVGFWGIAVKDREPSRAVAGGEASFCYGFLDAAGLLVREPGRPVLLVMADDTVPPPFDSIAGGPGTPHSVALLLESGAGPGSCRLVLDEGGAAPDGGLGLPALDFLRWHALGAAGDLAVSSGGRLWRWTR
ncbi:MAG: hypothetical protein A2X36_01165 [Elusimicrobia bacterium GWA2_69_24]|nr:MAG: hypothetical protein A2X36_01165 [Elusimicrobia bacterium GWA2_69_24]HBL16476.1 hypothetical protein [Elusimicrobiota bacterium]